MRIDEAAIRPKVVDDECAMLLSVEIQRFFLDRDRSVLDEHLTTTVNCPGCDEAGCARYMVKDGFTLQRCRTCGMVFVNPRPTESAAVDFFAQSKSIDRYSEMVEMTKAARQELIFQPLADFIGQNLSETNGPLLEVGCGSGLLLETLAARNESRALRGVELSRRAVEICRAKGLDVFHGSFEKLDETSAYDVIVFWAVFDHFFDPCAIARKAHRLLNPGGSILIGNMNIEGFDSMILGEDNGAFTPPERQNFFGPSSMRVMLRRAGFEDVRIRTTGRLDVDIVRNYWAAGGRRGRNEFLEQIVLGPPTVQDAFQQFLIENNLSGHMTVTAAKPQ
jgi:SAM-dependent methyltransferase